VLENRVRGGPAALRHQLLQAVPGPNRRSGAAEASGREVRAALAGILAGWWGLASALLVVSTSGALVAACLFFSAFGIGRNRAGAAG
jgi:hypothetical protein